MSDDDIEHLLFAVNEALSFRQRHHMPILPWMIPLANRFNLTSLTSGMSPTGHESDSGSSALESSLIGTNEAADLLGLSTRQVRRLTADLDGENISGRIVFKRSTVTEYAQERRHGR
ncbi:helix-turn-helix domain-containing protein [Mycobacterium sp. E802]|uniref:helix-turn-helix domain-containing protein n=1 Tax=Mycobacterium sp. E802 TaxID=1834152 RepID=UPI0012F8892D|nr:helix-turn-helix domain-containing protein [Mycobacterium sp. E802]